MGKLIVIDGLDGSGKSTQIDRLCAGLQKDGLEYRKISFPDYAQPSSALVKMYLAGEFGEAANAVNAYAASSFYAVDRYASFKKFWEADYCKNIPIIAARYATSNAIHQMAKLAKSEWNSYLAWLEDYEYTLLGLPKPDAVIFLDMPLEAAQKLMSGRYAGDESKKDIHERDFTYLRQCRESALYAAKRWNWQVISCAEKDEPLPPAVITEKIDRIVRDTIR